MFTLLDKVLSKGPGVHDWYTFTFIMENKMRIHFEQNKLSFALSTFLNKVLSNGPGKIITMVGPVRKYIQ